MTRRVALWRAFMTILLATAGAAAVFGAARPAAGIACVGDCAGNGVVDISDLMTGMNIALGQVGIAACPAFDRDGDGAVIVNELLQGVQSTLDGCVTDAAACERAAAAALSACVEGVNVAERSCFLDTGAACPPDDDE